MKIVITIDVDENGVVNVTTDQTEGKTEESTITNEYCRWFDEGCIGWTKDAEYSKQFLLAQQTYANDLLRSKGHLFLNEVYDMLGIPRTQAGQVVGWIYLEDNPIGDSHVDFGLHNEQNQNFINGYDNVAWLDFNVDGNIIDLI